ncbi:MAG: MBL fold metallo-hydrolase [Bacteroidetes bacterium]|uniref:MBL fold metallo-hydrolase n=1 Tax=Phnomibacter sp. TaxID=2836217 RepID=UPI002FDEF514|nr:MBL fold metallo-hydrolase [Bacteroidota bacterium]
MKISFHGATRTVTGSKHIVHLNDGRKVLLDCGMFQGMGKETVGLNSNFGFVPTDIDAVVLSHAHIDHSGLLPKLVQQGYLKSIHCTPATKDLATLLMEDSAGIQANDIKYLNKRRKQEGRPPLEPLYTEDDAKAASALLIEHPYQEWFTVIKDVECMFTDAGHIIGSACVHLRIQEDGETKHLTFSGDIGRYRDAILRSPETFPQADYIIMESTYGNSLHNDVYSSIDVLLEWITKTCLQKKGKLIIPAFSVGRTQEILYFLNQLELEKRLPPIDYYVDSPLSSEATLVVKNHPENYNESLQEVLKTDHDPFKFKGLHFIGSAEESKQLNYRKEPCVIISASGMAEAGRVKHHISNNIQNSRNTILLVGYCEPRSLGGRLKLKPKEVNIFGLPHEVHAEIGEMRSMSAHGDYDDMLQWLACQQTDQIKRLFLVHGEYDVQIQFADRLKRKGYKHVEIPEQHSEYVL